MGKTKSLKYLRREYKLNNLSGKTVSKNPFRQFESWFNEMMNAGLIEPNAMVLATAGSNSKPSVRVVLLKGLDNEGFTFFTNYKSRKGKEIHNNKFGSLLFYWAALERQVRIEGKIKKISRVESQKYFDTRPRYSQLAAWASAQSRIIPGREYLELQFQKYEKKFNGKKIPLPRDWGGYKLIPDYFEFWQGRENRLHDRIAYLKKKKKWEIVRLAP